MTHDACISIIIPVLNEAAFLEMALKAIEEFSGPYEVIIIDAGSTDQTPRIARESIGRVLQSKVRQRAQQMNLGASQAKGEILFFLHADTIVSPNALDVIREALRDPGTVGGAFARRYDHPSIFLRLTCHLADLRSKLFGWNFGDQGIFVRKAIFRRLKGYSEMDVFEDLDFSRRLAKLGHTVNLSPLIRTAGRRFGTTPIFTTCHDLILTIRYLVKEMMGGPRQEDQHQKKHSGK